LYEIINTVENRTDEELMELVAKGDEEAFGVIVKKYLPVAISYTTKFFGAKFNEDEIIQDTFVKMWKYATKWNASKGKVKTWFYSILSSTCCTYAKKHRRHFVCEEMRNLSDDNCNVESMLMQKQERAFVREKISNLNEREQQVIMLTYFEGHSNQHTAEIMGITVSAVETLLVRTRKKLRKSCEEGK